MRNTLRFGLALGLAAIALGATGSVVRITLKDQVSNVKLLKGDTLEVSLDQTDGKLVWTDDKTPAFLRLVSGPTTQPARKGIPACQIFHFEATGPGADMLTLKLVRLATPAAPPARQFTVSVSVPK